MEYKIDEELKKHGIKSIFDLTEFDQWVNKATREDINSIIEKQKVFGLKLWEYEIIEREQLDNICNFGVNYIFKIMDRNKILKLVNDYKRKKDFKVQNTMKFVNILSKLSIYYCHWV